MQKRDNNSATQQLKKILLVIDQYDGENNGTTMTARRLAEGLRNIGYEVKIVSTGKDAPDKFVVAPLAMPAFARNIISAQGMVIAGTDKATLRKAIEWADLVHFLMPFFLSNAGVKIARELNVPHTAAFHVQPQNITYSLGMGTAKLPNLFLYNFMRNHFFKYFRRIHCPSRFIARQLEEHDYTAQTYIISNGVAPQFRYTKTEKPAELHDRLIILMIGRFSKEKRQDLLIEAAKHSRYANRIQLIFAGKGPLKEQYIKQGRQLLHQPIFTFCTQEELITIISYSDLYVHTADAEIEAIACIEAFSCGLVPVIANSSQSATPQFALDERSLFEAGNAQALAEKIGYWFEHPEERTAQGIRYAEYGKEFNHAHCVKQMVRMFEDEMQDSFYSTR